MVCIRCFIERQGRKKSTYLNSLEIMNRNTQSKYIIRWDRTEYGIHALIVLVSIQRCQCAALMDTIALATCYLDIFRAVIDIGPWRILIEIQRVIGRTWLCQNSINDRAKRIVNSLVFTESMAEMDTSLQGLLLLGISENNSRKILAISVFLSILANRIHVIRKRISIHSSNTYTLDFLVLHFIEDRNTFPPL